MADAELKSDVQLRRKRHEEQFSNYQKAVTFISSFENWVEYRWGTNGKEAPGLLEYFNRFPHIDGLTPDFELKFRTPYIIWGDHKSTIQPSEKNCDDTEQIIKYAARASDVGVGYDVLLVVKMENDNVAALAIDKAREAYLALQAPEGSPPPIFAPIIVLGCYLDPESVKEWYILKWRPENNRRFTTPNISADPKVSDLNKLICEATHHSIRVDRSAMNREGRNPFINDIPPAMYTAIRLVIPALNDLLTDDDRDTLASVGRIEKTLTRHDFMKSDIICTMKSQPPKLESWIGAALDFLSMELPATAKKITGTDPQQYTITIDTALMKSDFREFFADRAAIHAAMQAVKGRRRTKKKSGGNDPRQGQLFD